MTHEEFYMECFPIGAFIYMARQLESLKGAEIIKVLGAIILLRFCHRETEAKYILLCCKLFVWESKIVSEKKYHIYPTQFGIYTLLYQQNEFLFPQNIDK